MCGCVRHADGEAPPLSKFLFKCFRNVIYEIQLIRMPESSISVSMKRTFLDQQRTQAPNGSIDVLRASVTLVHTLHNVIQGQSQVEPEYALCAQKLQPHYCATALWRAKSRSKLRDSCAWNGWGPRETCTDATRLQVICIKSIILIVVLSNTYHHCIQVVSLYSPMSLQRCQIAI